MIHHTLLLEDILPPVLLLEEVVKGLVLRNKYTMLEKMKKLDKCNKNSTQNYTQITKDSFLL